MLNTYRTCVTKNSYYIIKKSLLKIKQSARIVSIDKIWKYYVIKNNSVYASNIINYL